MAHGVCRIRRGRRPKHASGLSITLIRWCVRLVVMESTVVDRARGVDRIMMHSATRDSVVLE